MAKQKEQLTEEEAIKLLKRLEKHWPKTLWLFTNGQGISVMRLNESGERAMTGRGGGVDPDYCVTTINIPSDGGDW